MTEPSISETKMEKDQAKIDDEKRNFIPKGHLEKKPLIIQKTPKRSYEAIRPKSPFRQIMDDSVDQRDSFYRESVKVTSESTNSADREIRSIGELQNDAKNTPSLQVASTPPLYSHPVQYSSPPPHYPIYYPPPHPSYGYVPYHHPIMVSGESAENFLPKGIRPDYSHMGDEEQREARLVFKSKFATLRDNYPEKNFSAYDENMPLSRIHAVYEDYLKKISAENNSSFIRVALTLIFLGIEAFSIKVLNLDLQGYTKNQMAAMKKYDKLLIELGEKYSTTGETNWPVEARIIGLAVFNALVIVAVKFICEKMGSADSSSWMLDYVNSFFGSSVDNIIEKKPPPVVDPITRTTEPPKNVPKSDLMGNVKSLLEMSNQAFGKPSNSVKGEDLAQMIGRIGGSFISKEKKDPVVALAATTNKPSSKKIRFGKKKE